MNRRRQNTPTLKQRVARLERSYRHQDRVILAVLKTDRTEIHLLAALLRAVEDMADERRLLIAVVSEHEKPAPIRLKDDSVNPSNTARKMYT